MEQDDFLSDFRVFVIVAEEPALEAALLPDLVQIVGQPVLLIEPAAEDVLY